MSVVSALKDFIEVRDLQKWIDRHSTYYYDYQTLLDLVNDDSINVFCEICGFKYGYSLQNMNMVKGVIDIYDLNLIKSSDIVLDIGANIGLFSLPASARCKKVIAVEPLTTEELRYNIKVNGIENIAVIDNALGDGGSIPIKWRGMEKNMATIRFSDLPQCDVLKCDCEGGEWTITPSDLDGIRVIMGELHYSDLLSDKFGLYDYLSETREIIKEKVTKSHEHIKIIEFIAV